MADALARARTVTLLGAVWAALCSGTNYVYSAYAPQLGARLHITHTQLSMIGLSANMGVYSTGPLFGRITDKRGPRPLLIAAIVLHFAGYTGLRAYYDAGPVSEGMLPVGSVVAMALCSYISGAGANAVLVATTNATAKSFPESKRATAVGLVLSGFGLSAFLFSTVASFLFPGNTSSFLLFLSLGTSVPVIVGVLTVRPVRAGGGGAPLLGGEDGGRRGGGYGAVGTGGEPVHAERVGPQSGPSSPISEEPARHTSSSSAGTPKTFRPSDPVDRHGKRLFTGWEFWVLFSILSLLSGTGLMFINNVGSISEALSAKGDPDFDRVRAAKYQATQVSLISLANCAGRLGLGAGADVVRSRFAGHRSYLLSGISTLFIVSQIVGARVEDVSRLWLASVILGLGYGGIFGLLPTITIDWFGLAHFSENWGFVSLAPLLGGNLFSILFGRILDAHVPAATADAEGRRRCLEGRTCYSGAMYATTGACVLALGLSVVAAWRDRRKAAGDRDGGYERVAQNEGGG